MYLGTVKLGLNGLQGLGHAEAPPIDEGIRQQLPPIVALLDARKTPQQPLAFVLPRQGPLDTGSQGMDRFIENELQVLQSALPS
jgi:hypothetical protein